MVGPTMADAVPTTAKELELSEVNLMDPAWFAAGPPHELFARMRAEAPVRWNRLPDGSGFWSLTRHADIAAVSRDTDTFSSYRAGIFLHPDQVTPLELNRNLLLYKDPPEHTKYRRILQTAFVPNTVAKLEDSVRARITRVIDAVIERGSCDFVSDIAVPVPLGVLAELMGVPDEDIPRLYEWTEQIEEAQRSPEPAAAMETFAEMAAYLHQQIERQISESGESLVTKLREAEVDGERLDDNEILVFFGLLVFAGNDTTRNTASSGILALLEHPEQYTMLREEPDLIPQAVEEILRFTSVVNYFVRTATRDTAIDGQPIAEGEKVLMWYTSASRDENVYNDPQRFDITRPEQDHKAFGGGGRHFCLGAGLARLELRVLLEELTRRMPDLALAGEVKRLESTWANSLTSLPVSFTAAARGA
jgi:cholest-4-en-3-one 26-monooxygenase